MSVWYCIPSARPPEQAGPVLDKWRERGYKIALFVDWNPPGLPLYSRAVCGDVMLCGGGKWEPKYETDPSLMLGLQAPLDPMGKQYPPHFNGYPGYAMAVNALVAEVLEKDHDCDWIVTGGDDVLPDPNHTAEEIAAQCLEYFSDLHKVGLKRQGIAATYESSTFGVMQPTGDRWGDCTLARKQYGENRGAYIDRVCGSPWMGREFCKRIYGGKGPLWPEFSHMFVDEHLQAVAEKLGILQQRPDLIHQHEHWGRKEGATHADVPAFLAHVNTKQHWNESKAIFDRLKAGGFAEATL